VIDDRETGLGGVEVNARDRAEPVEAEGIPNAVERREDVPWLDFDREFAKFKIAIRCQIGQRGCSRVFA